jgi:hypothetical protein
LHNVRPCKSCQNAHSTIPTKFLHTPT